MNIKSNISIPIASFYDYSNYINDKDILNAISIIDRLYSNNRIRFDKPTFQTIDNLFLFNEFNKFKFTFLKSCNNFINLDQFNYTIHAFCYMDYYDNWILKNRSLQWHKHETSSIIGVMYLKNDERLIHKQSGTEFADDDLNSIGYIDPVPYSWHLFSGNRMHRSGIIHTNNKRYVLTGSLHLSEK